MDKETKFGRTGSGPEGNNALATFRKTEIQYKNSDVDSTKMSVLDGSCLLHERHHLHQSIHSACHPLFCLSTGTVLAVYKFEPFVTGWDEDKVMNSICPHFLFKIIILLLFSHPNF